MKSTSALPPPPTHTKEGRKEGREGRKDRGRKEGRQAGRQTGKKERWFAKDNIGLLRTAISSELLILKFS